MPVGFHSLSHGVLPFGFFNIASDLLILNDHFAFASEVCGWFSSWATQVGTEAEFSEEVPMWVIDDPDAIGDLGGAIRGSDHRGLIGRSYSSSLSQRDGSTSSRIPRVIAPARR